MLNVVQVDVVVTLLPRFLGRVVESKYPTIEFARSSVSVGFLSSLDLNGGFRWMGDGR